MKILENEFSAKAVSQVEKSVSSKLEDIIAQQIQTQIRTSFKQAIKETLESSMEASVIPESEMSCRSIFEQVDATFQKGMTEHATAVLQQCDLKHSQLALSLKLEAPLDHTEELSRLIAERKYEEAFTTALQRNDVSIVSWLRSQLSLDISNEMPKNLSWMRRDALSAINVLDPIISVHTDDILKQVHVILIHHYNLPTTGGVKLYNIRLILYVNKGMLMVEDLEDSNSEDSDSDYYCEE